MFDYQQMRPRGKGRKLAWQGALHENTMMLRMRMLPNVLPVATCQRCPRRGLSHGPTACEPASRGAQFNYEISCDWRFQPQPPPNTLLHQEGLQLAEASFCDINWYFCFCWLKFHVCSQCPTFLPCRTLIFVQKEKHMTCLGENILWVLPRTQPGLQDSQHRARPVFLGEWWWVGSSWVPWVPWVPWVNFFWLRSSFLPWEYPEYLTMDMVNSWFLQFPLAYIDDYIDVYISMRCQPCHQLQSMGVAPGLQGFNGSRVDFLTIVFLAKNRRFKANQLPSLKPWEITKTCCLLRHFSLSIGSKYGKPNSKLSRISPGMHDKPTRIGGYYWAYHFLNHSATLHNVVTSICLCLDLSRTGRRPLWHLNQHFSGVHWHSFAIAVNNGWCNTTTSTGHCGARAPQLCDFDR